MSVRNLDGKMGMETVTHSKRGGKMSKLPKLKVKLNFGYPNEDICELEQAKYRFSYGGGVVVVVEGQVVNSHEELLELATHDNYKDREFLDVLLIADIPAGG